MNYYLRAVVRNVSGLIGADLNDPRATYPGLSYYLSTTNAGRPGREPSPPAAHLFGRCGPDRSPSPHEPRDAGTYALALLAAFALFCICTKWQVWHNRSPASAPAPRCPIRRCSLLGSFLAISSPAVAVVLPRRVIARTFANENRPWWTAQYSDEMTREEQYYMVRNQWRPAYRKRWTLRYAELH